MDRRRLAGRRRVHPGLARGTVVRLCLLPLLACLALVAACGAPGGGPALPAKGRTLSVACFGGEIEEQARGLVGDLVEATLGCKVEFELGTSRSFLDQLRTHKGQAPPFDVVYLDDIIQEIAIREGLLQPIPEEQLYFHDDLTSNAAINTGYGPGIQFFSVGLAYNTAEFRRHDLPAPTSWSDLWAMKDRLKGRIGIPSIIHSAGMDLFLASLALGGGSLEDSAAIEAAVQRIAALEPAIVYESSTDAAERLARGELWVTPTYNSRAFGKELEGAPVGWVIPREGGFGHLTCVSLVAGSRNEDLAMAYINTATSPAVQMAQSLGAPYGPTNTMTFGVLAAYPEIHRRFPLGPSDFAHLKIPPWEQVNTHREEIERRWHEAFPDS